MPSAINTHIDFRIPDDLSIQSPHQQAFHFPAHTAFIGNLSLDVWDGPYGVLEYTHPSFFKLECTLQALGFTWVLKQYLSVYDLIFVNGEETFDQPIESNTLAGPIQFLLDNRKKVSFYRNKVVQEMFMKLVDVNIFLYPIKESAWIKCRYFDHQHSQQFQEVYYERSYASLLFKNYLKLYLDSSGKVEDYDLHGEKFVHLERSGSTELPH